VKCDICQEHTLKLQINALEDVIGIARASVSSLDIDGLLNTILYSVMAFMDMPVGRILLYDASHSTLVLHTYLGLSDDSVSKEQLYVSPETALSLLLKSNRIFSIEDISLSNDSKINTMLDHDSIKSHVAIPLISDNCIHGILCLDDFEPRQFDAVKISMLSMLSAFVAMSITNAKAHRETLQLSICDALTGLFNRRHLDVVMHQELERARRHGCTFSLMLIDVDHFKKLNDTFGHQLGDQVLKMIGSLFKETLRGMDLCFRYGGEEFLVILPMTQIHDALIVAERLRQLIFEECRKVLREIFEMPVTVSIGVASYSSDVGSVTELLSQADRRLYLAKQGGRNQVVYSA
jgi:diguanylate cyclase (GGDEF)-like protein